MCGERAVAQTYMALFSFIFIQLILLDTQGVRELTCHAEGNLLFQGTLFCLFSYRRDFALIQNDWELVKCCFHIMRRELAIARTHKALFLFRYNNNFLLLTQACVSYMFTHCDNLFGRYTDLCNCKFRDNT